MGETAFSTSQIIVDVKDVRSVVSLGNDDLGEKNGDGNVLSIARYISNGTLVEQERVLTLPGDAFRDSTFIDWILADKSNQGELADDFQDLLLQNHELATKGGKLGRLDVLVARDQVTRLSDQDSVIDVQISNDDPQIDQVLQAMQAQYGEQLKGLSEREVYNLFKQHTLSAGLK